MVNSEKRRRRNERCRRTQFSVLGRKGVCGVRKLSGGKEERESGEWRNDEGKQLVREEKQACNRYLHRRKWRLWVEYMSKSI